MRLYRSGDEGEPVRDIQDRLHALGFTSDPDPRGRFGDGTTRAVSAFQEKRGLWVDGIVGPDTWSALVGAGYRLGSRLLYHRIPMMRGDDVAELQRRLNSLGFDIGKVDAILGPDTLRGLMEFQSNRRLAEDGLAGPEVISELELMVTATRKPGRETVRDHQWLERLPESIAGQHVYIDPFCRDAPEATTTWGIALTLSRVLQDLGVTPVMSRSIDTRPPERTRAARANRLGVDIVISICLPHEAADAVLYFASQHSSSQAGAALATEIGTCLDIPTRGSAIPMLRETRAPAVVVATDDPGGHTAGGITQGLINLFIAHHLANNR